MREEDRVSLRSCELMRRTQIASCLVTLIACSSTRSDDVGQEPAPSADATQSRRIRVVDETGVSVAGAEVRLEAGAPWDPVVVASATTGPGGWATVVESGPDRTRIHVRASDPPRRHVSFGDFDPVQLAWSVQQQQSLVVDIQELWVGGVDVPPGERIVHARQVSWGGFTPGVAHKRIKRPWLTTWPDAAWVDGFLNPAVEGDAVDVLLAVFGKQPTVVRVPMTRASKLTGPTTIEVVSIPDRPWVEIPLVFRDPDGTLLSAAAQDAAREGVWLVRRDDEMRHEFYPLGEADHPPLVTVPCGTYDLKLGFVEYPAEPRSLGPIEIRSEMKALDITLPFALRSVVLELPGIGRDGYALSAEHAGGFRGRWVGAPGDAGQTIDLVLPPGTNELSLEYTTCIATKFHRRTHTISVGNDRQQVETWVLTAR